jgi:hypothetical protein
MGEKRNAYRVLVGKPKEKDHQVDREGRWDDNIKLDLGEIGWGRLDWINLAQDRDHWRAHVNTVMNFRVP